MTMTRGTLIAVVLLLLAVGVASAHDMFLKPTRYFAPEHSEVRVRVLNGTFSRSENSIARNRLMDASVLSPRGRTRIDTTEWSVRGDTSTFHVHTRDAGTYVIGASTKPLSLDLTADEFNLYIEEDGLPDVLAARRAAGEMQRPVRELYHKHVKALLQVGEARSSHYVMPLGYPAEIIPIENPYALSAGAMLHVRALVDGKPVANQYLLFGGAMPDGTGFEQRGVRTDAEGIASIPLAAAGTWYIKFIHMERVQRDSLDYESKWATLTFEVR